MASLKRGLSIIHRTDEATAEKNSERRAHRHLKVLLESEDPTEVGAAILALGRLDDPGLRLVEGGGGDPGEARGGAP